MTTTIPRLLFASLLLGVTATPQAAEPNPIEEPLPFSALIRQNDGDVLPIEVTLPPGESETLDLGNGYLLEIAAPRDDLGYGVARLLQQQPGGEPLPRHTLRQPWRGDGWSTLGYLICGEQVIFHQPRDGRLPECSSYSYRRGSSS